MSADPLADETRRNATVALIRHLYVDLEQPTGGPLHVQLDDDNLDDYWVSEAANSDSYDYLFDGSFERYAQAGDNTSGERKNAIRDTCEAILALLRPMSERERRTVTAEFWSWWRPRAGERMRAALAAEDDDEQEPYEEPSGSSKACVSIPCPPFTEVSLEEVEYSPQAHPTADDLARAGVDLAPYAKPPGWEPEDPLLVKLYDARLETAVTPNGPRPRLAAGESIALDPVQRQREKLADLTINALRSLPQARATAHVPPILTLPEGVTAEQAMEWIRGCERLGIIEPSEAGTLLLPHGLPQ